MEKQYTIQEVREMICEFFEDRNVYKSLDEAAGMPKSPAMVTIPANSKEHCESIYQQYKESRPDRVAYVYGQCLYVGEE